MMAYRQNTALAQYQSNDIAGAMGDASPHQLVQMLLAGALDRLAQAKGGVMRADRPQKLQGVAKAVAIIEHLRLNLDHQAGGEIARNLENLYDYMVRRLLKANVDDDVKIIDEVAGLLRDVKSAWDAIPMNLRSSSVS
jgi:flagellar protein FliS